MREEKVEDVNIKNRGNIVELLEFWDWTDGYQVVNWKKDLHKDMPWWNFITPNAKIEILKEFRKIMKTVYIQRNENQIVTWLITDTMLGVNLAITSMF